MDRRKRKTYEPYHGELRQRGVRYQPMVWSCYGRAHVEAGDIMQALARAAARRRGLPEWRPLLLRARSAISVEIQRRLVAQVRRCLPEDSPGEPHADTQGLTRVPEEEEAMAAATAAHGAAIDEDDSAAAKPTVDGTAPVYLEKVELPSAWDAAVAATADENMVKCGPTSAGHDVAASSRLAGETALDNMVKTESPLRDAAAPVVMVDGAAVANMVKGAPQSRDEAAASSMEDGAAVENMVEAAALSRAAHFTALRLVYGRGPTRHGTCARGLVSKPSRSDGS